MATYDEIYVNLKLWISCSEGAIWIWDAPAQQTFGCFVMKKNNYFDTSSHNRNHNKLILCLLTNAKLCLQKICFYTEAFLNII